MSPGHRRRSGCSAAWQRASFGTKRSWVQIPPPRQLKHQVRPGTEKSVPGLTCVLESFRRPSGSHRGAGFGRRLPGGAGADDVLGRHRCATPSASVGVPLRRVAAVWRRVAAGRGSSMASAGPLSEMAASGERSPAPMTGVATQPMVDAWRRLPTNRRDGIPTGAPPGGGTPPCPRPGRPAAGDDRTAPAAGKRDLVAKLHEAEIPFPTAGSRPVPIWTPPSASAYPPPARRRTSTRHPAW